MSENEITNQVMDNIENSMMAILKKLTETIKSQRYQRTDSITNLSMALLKAQSEFNKAKINTRGYGYNYANLESVLDACRPALVANDLVLIQLPTNDDNKIILTTLLVHKSGEFISYEISGLAQPTMTNQGKVKTTAIQAKGSVITYLRRYSMSAMLGISTGDDNDGAEVQDEPPNKQPKRQPFYTPVAPLKQPKSTPKPQKELTPIEWLQSLETVTYADICNALIKAGHFFNAGFAMDMINKYPNYAASWYDDNGNLKGEIKSDKTVTKESALNVFDWCVSNKGKEGSND